MRTVHVLLVDDNTDFLAAAKKFLSSLGGVVVAGCATGAEEGIARCADLRPDLVLIDVVMPGMSGFDATSLLKQGANAPEVVLLTLHNTEAYRTRARSAGADGFIAKDELVAQFPPLIESLFPGWHP